MKKLLFCLSTLYLFAFQLNCQNKLAVFDNLIGKEWTGHYQNSEDSVYVHFIEWEYELEHHLVIQSKKVPELNYYSKTYFFFDYETNQISFISIANKDLLSKGEVLLDSNELELTGITYYNNVSIEFKQSFRLDKDGSLKDFFLEKLTANGCKVIL